MTKLQTKLATAAATGAMLFNSVIPAFAATHSFNVTGNGSDSDSAIDFNRSNETGVFQTNNASVVNDISISSNTGGNDVSDNTGGDVDVETGDVKVGTTIVNQLNSNQAEIEACDCDSDTDVKVAGNGSDSENDVAVDTSNANVIVQDNVTNILNALDIEGNSGDNDANDNTGGEVNVRTGNVKITPVEIVNIAGVNAARIGNDGVGSHDSANLSLTVKGNGSDSDNDVEVNNSRETGIFQMNDSLILNELYFGGFTGDNEVNDNTGSADTDPSLRTGNVTIAAGIYNETGYNWADADCGCVLGVMGSISENGTESESDITLDLEDTTEVAQDNMDELLNAGEVMSDTGENDLNDNTSGEVNARTGNTETVIEAVNLGGFNGFGGVEIEMPLGFSFSIGR